MGWGMNYLELIQNAFRDADYHTTDKVEFLASDVFGIVTYDTELDEFFITKALEVCEAINNGRTFEYIEEPDNYLWYIALLNMPFFADKINWGTSVRGAFWDNVKTRLWGEEMEFSSDEWKLFVSALLEFAGDK